VKSELGGELGHQMLSFNIEDKPLNPRKYCPKKRLVPPVSTITDKKTQRSQQRMLLRTRGMKQYEAKKAIKSGIYQSDLEMMSNKSRRCVQHKTQTTR